MDPGDPLTILVLVVAGFVAAFIDGQVGGGGVISLPTLLAVGLPPKVALGTNKLAGTTSALFASANYLRSGVVPVKPALRLAPLSLVGGAIGVWAVHKSDATWLTPVILVVMGAMALWVLFRPRFGLEDHPVKGPWPWVAMALCALDVGVYDGILGPGTGSFLLFGIVSLLGFGFRKAAAMGRVLNLASNVAALGLFLWFGLVDWRAGIPMSIAMAAGAWTGSHVTLTHGDRYLKPLFVAITLVLMVRLALRMTGTLP